MMRNEYNRIWALVLTWTCAGVTAVGAAADSSEHVPGPGAPGKALSLNQAIQVALANNPELKGAAARLDAASGRAAQAPVWPNPELLLSVEEWPVSRGGGFSDAQ